MIKGARVLLERDPEAVLYPMQRRMKDRQATLLTQIALRLLEGRRRIVMQVLR